MVCYVLHHIVVYRLSTAFIQYWVCPLLMYCG